MRIEVRRRSESSRHGVSPSNPTLTEAYSDKCFETQTRFFIVAPEHPKLGKWTQPSTLKYGQYPAMSNHQSLDEHARPATSCPRRSRPSCSSPAARGRVGPSDSTAPALIASNNRSVCRSSQMRQSAEARRTPRPVSPLCARSESPPSSTARGRQEVPPRIDTPISGRVAPLHQRSFQAFPLPSSPYLCGSFDQHQHTAGIPYPHTTAPTQQHVNRLTEDGEALDSLPPATETTRSPSSDSEGRSLRVGRRREREKAEPQVEPDVRYRVRLENIALHRVGDQGEDGAGGSQQNNRGEKNNNNDDNNNNNNNNSDYHPRPQSDGLLSGQVGEEEIYLSSRQHVNRYS